MRTARKKVIAVLAVAGLVGAYLVLGAAPAAGSMVLTLSEHSSDSTPAGYLNSTFNFDVSGDILTLTIANLTQAPHAYYINQAYFNASPNVTGLELLGAGGWHLNFAEDHQAAAPFGKFDASLIGGVGHSQYEVAPGQSLSFTMEIEGSGPFTAQDFTGELSYTWGGQIPSLGAAKFIRGPCGDSARGNSTLAGGGTHTPEPMTLSFLAAGLVGTWLVRRRK